jgi:hypothetical protein
MIMSTFDPPELPCDKEARSYTFFRRTSEESREKQVQMESDGWLFGEAKHRFVCGVGCIVTVMRREVR